MRVTVYGNDPLGAVIAYGLRCCGDKAHCVSPEGFMRAGGLPGRETDCIAVDNESPHRDRILAAHKGKPAVMFSNQVWQDYVSLWLGHWDGGLPPTEAPNQRARKLNLYPERCKILQNRFYIDDTAVAIVVDAQVDAQDFLDRFAYTQWTLEEVRSGEALLFILTFLHDGAQWDLGGPYEPLAPEPDSEPDPLQELWPRARVAGMKKAALREILEADGREAAERAIAESAAKS